MRCIRHMTPSQGNSHASPGVNTTWLLFPPGNIGKKWPTTAYTEDIYGWMTNFQFSGMLNFENIVIFDAKIDTTWLSTLHVY